MKFSFLAAAFILLSATAFADQNGWTCQSTLFVGNDGDEVIGDTYSATGADRNVVQQEALVKCQVFIDSADATCVANGCEPTP